MGSIDTSSSAISLFYYTTLLANHTATTLCSKSCLFLRSPTGTLIAEFSSQFSLFILSFLRFYIILWQYIYLTIPSAHLSMSPLFSSANLCSLNIATLTFLSSSISFLLNEVKSNSEECTTFTDALLLNSQIPFSRIVHVTVHHMRDLAKLRICKTKPKFTLLLIFCIYWEYHNPLASQPIPWWYLQPLPLSCQTHTTLDSFILNQANYISNAYLVGWGDQKSFLHIFFFSYK